MIWLGLLTVITLWAVIVRIAIRELRGWRRTRQARAEILARLFAAQVLWRIICLALLTLWMLHAHDASRASGSNDAFAYGAGTERFIPCGRSPGVSGTPKSVAGRLVALDHGTLRLCVETARGARACTHYSHAMAIYLDRSARREQNRVGAWRDLRLGQIVEVYPTHWIKVCDPATEEAS